MLMNIWMLWKKFNVTSLSEKEEFQSNLNMKNNADSD